MQPNRSSGRVVLPALVAAALLGVGCAHRYPLPYPAALLAQDSQKDPGRALAHYLSQPNADPAACDMDGSAPHVARIDDDLLERLADALLDGKVAPEPWIACNRALLPHVTAAQATLYVPMLAKVVSKKAADADANPAIAARLAAIGAVLASRPADAQAAAMREAVQPVAQRLRALLDGDTRLGPVATGLVRDVLTTLELDVGVLGGKPVTADSIDATTDQGTLRRFVARLADPNLRAWARSRLIRVRVAESTRPEVRANAAAVEEALARTGRWAPDPAAHPIARAWFRSETSVATSVLVRQDVLAGRVTLLAASGTDLLATAPLRGELLFDLVGFEQPVTLCEPADHFSTEPCVEAARVALGTPAATLDADGVAHFSEALSIADAIALLDAGGALVLKPTADGRELARLQLPLRFERPPNLTYTADAFQRGPDLFVHVQPVGARLIFEVARAASAAPPHRFVLENADVAAFALASVGATGAPGSPGSRGHDGFPGMPGMAASCPSMSGGRGGDGGPGGRGKDGGMGGAGSDGGNIQVGVACSGPCPELTSALANMIQSVGGAGGPGGTGGAGGSGGMGGSGGSGMSCYSNGRSTMLSNGISGNRGIDGARGNDGPSGMPGRPGRVVITVR